MSNAYIKPRKRKERLATRIKDYEKTADSLGSRRNSITKPGSMNK